MFDVLLLTYPTTSSTFLSLENRLSRPINRAILRVSKGMVISTITALFGATSSLGPVANIFP